MMRAIFLLASVVSALAALWLWLDLPVALHGQPASITTSQPSPATRQVALLAARDLSAGTRITGEDMIWTEITSADTGLITRDRMPDATALIAGLTLRGAIAAGTPLLWDNLSSQTEAALSARIAPGKFAYSITVTEATAAGALILPGDRIDLLGTITSPGSNQRQIEVIAADLPVLAVDQTMTRPSDASTAPNRTLTIEVDLPQIKTIITAGQAGGLTVALRSAQPAP